LGGKKTGTNTKIPTGNLWRTYFQRLRVKAEKAYFRPKSVDVPRQPFGLRQSNRGEGQKSGFEGQNRLVVNKSQIRRQREKNADSGSTVYPRDYRGSWGENLWGQKLEKPEVGKQLRALLLYLTTKGAGKTKGLPFSFPGIHF